MEDKKLTPQESMDVITSMIEATRQRIATPDTRISVMWAILTIATAAIVLTVSLIGDNPWCNLIWLAIPVIGLPVNMHMTSKEKKGAKTAIDKMTDRIWSCVGLIAIALSVGCLIANLLGYPQAWLAMFYYAFVVVGFGTTMQGIVIAEKSYVYGGLFAILSGFVLIVLGLCQVPLLLVWALPLYMVCFLLMFLVPALVIKQKLARQNR